MTRARDSHIYRSLASVIPPRRVRRLARQMRVVQRRRKVDPVALVNALVLGFDGGERRTIAGLRRAYERTTGTTLAPSAFYDRLTPELAGLLQQLSHEAFADLGRRVPSMALALQAFQQVFAADGSLVRLHDTLQQHYPSVWTNHTKASAKVHVLMDAASRLPLTVQVVPGSRHDLNILQIGPWVRDRLLIFDLAYYQGEKFRSIQEHGGFFLCRVKKDANFVVLGSSHPDQVGKRLQQVLREERGRTFDVEVDYAYRRILQRDYQWRRLRLRIVGVWNEQARRHRLYITNASAVQLAAQHLGAVYALRWEIELLFRELKSVYRIDHMPSGRRGVTECLLYAVLLTVAMSRRLLRLVAGGLPGLLRPFPTDRWAMLFRLVSRDLLELATASRPHRLRLSRRLHGLLRHEARDPNRCRLLLPSRAQLGILNPVHARA